MKALILTFVLFLTGIPTALGATRTVCFGLATKDARDDCPSSGTGVRRVCNPGTWVYPVGMSVEFWDKDPGTGSDDDYIGMWRQGTSRTCVTFEWENASYAEGEANPDVYLVIKNTVLHAGSLASLQIVDADSQPYSHPWSRNGWGGDPDAGTAVDCLAGNQCQIPTLYVTSNEASDYGKALMALDSAQRSLAVYYSHLDSGTINIETPSDNPNAEYGLTIDRHLIQVGSEHTIDGTRITHEMGHVLQMCEFGLDDLINDSSLNGGGWEYNLPEYDSCAVTEGWASYAGVVAWWDPDVAGAAPIAWGYSVDSETPTDTSSCGANNGIPLQSARAFWDLDDVDNESAIAPATAADLSNLSTLGIAGGWDNFAHGTANRQDEEASVNGVNIYDYDYNYNVSDATLIQHNCLDAQAP